VSGHTVACVELFDRGFQCQADAEQFDVGGFRAKDVGFAVQLVARKIRAGDFALCRQVSHPIDLSA
jgi:hypothetical protein